MRLMMASGLTIATLATLSASEVSFNGTVEAVQWSGGLISLVVCITMLSQAFGSKSLLAPSLVGMSFSVGVTLLLHAALLHTYCPPDVAAHTLLGHALIAMAGFYVGSLFAHLVTLGNVVGDGWGFRYRTLAVFGVMVGPVIAAMGWPVLC
jgi:hypothetical protein